jgi:hydroxymethylbilane synthase
MNAPTAPVPAAAATPRKDAPAAQPAANPPATTGKAQATGRSPATGQSPAPTRGSSEPADASRPLRLGTRRSALAKAQSQRVADAVAALSGRPVELVEIVTRGDTTPALVAQIGGTGVFVTALRDAVLRGEVDFAVHSLKDLPTGQPDDLVIAATPRREDPRDVLVARDGLTFAQLPDGARVGTGSARRTAQLRARAREHGRAIQIVPVRGNIDTRIGYVREGKLDAVVLAAAGLNRLGRSGEVTDTLPVDTVLPAPGQGALAVECAAVNVDLVALLAELDDPGTRIAVTAERSLLAALEAGCTAPVGALADLLADGQIVNEMRLRAVVGTPDGSTLVQLSTTGPVPASHRHAVALGRDLASELLAKGAAGLMGERAH